MRSYSASSEQRVEVEFFDRLLGWTRCWWTGPAGEESPAGEATLPGTDWQVDQPTVRGQQSSCGRSNTLRTMRMTSSKCVLQQRHLLGYESEPEP